MERTTTEKMFLKTRRVPLFRFQCRAPEIHKTLHSERFAKIHAPVAGCMDLVWVKAFTIGHFLVVP